MASSQVLDTQLQGGLIKGANERSNSFVFVHQHGGDNVTWKPPIVKSTRHWHMIDGVDLVSVQQKFLCNFMFLDNRAE